MEHPTGNGDTTLRATIRKNRPQVFKIRKKLKHFKKIPNIALSEV